MKLLAIDIGNTTTVLGIFEGKTLREKWRVSSVRERTEDEWWILIKSAVSCSFDDVVVSSVVPPISQVLRSSFEKHWGRPPLFLEPGVKTGLPIVYDPPSAVGADRVANAVAGAEKYGYPLIIVDFGTAITFDVVSAKREYIGGVIAPGVSISSEALFTKTAKLPKVELAEPRRVIGRNTVSSIQSGLFYGFKGLVEGILEKLYEELGGPVKVVATGGEAGIFCSHVSYIQHYDPDLTLEGLRIIYELNREDRVLQKG